MTYEYRCTECEQVFDLSCPMGQAPAEAGCTACGARAKRHFGQMNFVLKGGSWPRRTRVQKNEQTRKNEEAGRRMRKNRDPAPKLQYEMPS